MSQALKFPKGDCLDTTYHALLLDSLTFNWVNPLPGEYKFNFNCRSFLFAMHLAYPLCPTSPPSNRIPFSLFSLSIDWHNQVETISLYWVYANSKIKMKCYYMFGKKKKKRSSGSGV